MVASLHERLGYEICHYGDAYNDARHTHYGKQKLVDFLLLLIEDLFVLFVPICKKLNHGGLKMGPALYLAVQLILWVIKSLIR